MLIVDLPNPDSNWPSFAKYTRQDIEQLCSDFQVSNVERSETIFRCILKK